MRDLVHDVVDDVVRVRAATKLALDEVPVIVLQRVVTPLVLPAISVIALGLFVPAHAQGAEHVQDPPPAAEKKVAAPVTPAATPPAPASAAKPAQDATTNPLVWQPRYHSFDEAAQLVAGWIAAGAASKIDLPATRGGLSVPALELGAPGPVALAQRPTIFLVGGLDGLSLTGCEAVLAITSELVEKRASLPPDVAFVVVPWGSPDALTDTFAGHPAGGRDHLALDDDGDLALDEDPPDDADKDGLLLDMIVEDPTGPLARAGDSRFLAAARPGDRPRYRLWREGRDDDHDGRFNEDPIGGVVLDLAFPVGWNSGAGDASGGASRSAPLPLDDPLSRGLADLVLARTSLAVLLFQGNHGEIARPGGTPATAEESQRDAGAFDAVARLFTTATGRLQKSARPVRDARGEDRAGCALDWIHAVPGALALEVAAWGPEVERGTEPKDVGVTSARFENKDDAGSAPAVTAQDRAWARWLDNTRGGIGFVDWHPVDLGDGTKALVGGWEPFSRVNAPATSLPAATAGLGAFVIKLAQAAPRLALEVLEEKRDGDVITLRWRVQNTGGLLTGISTLAKGRPEHAPRCELVLPAGARLLWGETGGVLSDLPAGGASRELTSVVLAPEGSVLTLRATSGWTVPAAREVKP